MHEKYLTAPGGVVGAPTETVEREPKHRPFNVVLCHNGCNMRMVVLNSQHRDRVVGAEFMGNPRAVEVWMPVVRKGKNTLTGICQPGFDGAAQRPAGFRVAQITVVIRPTPAPIARQNRPVGEHGAEANHRRRRLRVVHSGTFSARGLNLAGLDPGKFLLQGIDALAQALRP